MPDPRLQRRMICTECFEECNVVPKITWAGYPTFTCDECGSPVKYPLEPGRRGLCYIVVTVTALFGLAALARGQFPLPGVLGVFAIVMLAEDKSLRDKVGKAERKHVERNTTSGGPS